MLFRSDDVVMGSGSLDYVTKNIDNLDDVGKTRLPRSNGNWDGDPGNGKWFSDNDAVKNITGGEGVDFANGRPDFSPWSKGNLEFPEGVLNGTADDFNLVYDKIKEMKGFSSRNQAKQWLKEVGLTPTILVQSRYN